ncbi:MAG: TolC family protein [Mucilaginibacter polytrichastri]|nr:TolC family protein [Mucilaginibacter polytrichastri]
MQLNFSEYTKSFCRAALILLFSPLIFGCAQDAGAQQPPDTAKVFALSDLEGLVISHHPIVKQAFLLSESAQASVLQARGYFDPKISAAFQRKMFANSEYYNYWTSELKVPVWLGGADLKLGYDRNVGTYTNPETRTGLPGLVGVGLSVPLGQGLLIDARRNTLKQARIMVNYAEAEQVKQINGVWYDAVKDYWSWYYAFRQFNLISDGLDAAERRYVALRRQVLIGDKPPIDSVEAFITVQERQIQKAKSAIELQNTRLVLSNHLWSENGDPVELPEAAVPERREEAIDAPNPMQLDTLLDRAAEVHPELIKLRSKSDQLNIERRYRGELLKPKINVSGTLLTSRRDLGGYVPPDYDFNWGNYKVGLDFSFPLFLRAERGKLREVKIKQQEVSFDLQQSGREIRNSIETSFNSLKAYQSQLLIQMQSIQNQQALLQGETQKFDLGESTLFLINSRETKLIDMRIKREELISGYQKTLAELYYKAGTRQNNL